MLQFTRRITDVLPMNDSIISKSFTWQRGFNDPEERYMARCEVVSRTPMGSIYELKIADKMYGAVKREKDYTYNQNTDVQEGVGSEIVKDLFSTAGVPYDSTSVPTTGTDTALKISLYPAKGKILASLKDLGNNYIRDVFYRDSEDKGYFVTEDFEPTSATIVTGKQIGRAHV